MIDSGGPPPAVRVERTLRAPAERVFDAFLDPGLIRQWMAPEDLRIDRVEVEAKVGGRIEVWHSRDGASTGKFVGRFLQIDPPRTLVYQWAFVGTEPEKGEFFDTLVTVQLRATAADRTHVVVLHEKLGELARGAPHILPKLEPGWNQCLEQLERLLRAAA